MSPAGAAGSVGQHPEKGFIEHRDPEPLSAGADRCLARRCWTGAADADLRLTHRAGELASQAAPLPGRVHTGGELKDPGVWQLLAQHLPPGTSAHLRRRFEWYVCRGAGFHTDAHYDAVLFGVWALAGPARDIVFAPCGTRVPCALGSLVVFDPFRPHSVLDAGQSAYRRERFAAAPASVFLGFEIELAAAVRETFGIGPPSDGAFAIRSCTAVNAESGAMGR